MKNRVTLIFAVLMVASALVRLNSFFAVAAIAANRIAIVEDVNDDRSIYNLAGPRA